MSSRARRSVPLVAVATALVAAFLMARPRSEILAADPADASTRARAALSARLKPLHGPMDPARPGDWRLGPGKDERGQSYLAWSRSRPVRATKTRRTLYMQVIGAPPANRTKVIDLAQEFLRLYFGLPVKALAPAAIDADWPYYARRTRAGTSREQLLSRYILYHVLKPSLPADGAALLGLTHVDLWPGRGWNFVFGEASFESRVGVWSLSRFGDPSTGAASLRQCLLRTLRVASHETGHMFSIEHCIAYRCNMNGSNSLSEKDDDPLALCPECAPKIWDATGVDPHTRYRDLAAFCERNGLKRDAALFRKSQKALAPASVK